MPKTDTQSILLPSFNHHPMSLMTKASKDNVTLFYFIFVFYLTIFTLENRSFQFSSLRTF